VSFRGRREVAIGLATYATYLGVRAAVFHDRGRERAARNCRRLVAAEQAVGLDVEQRVQSLALRTPRLVTALNLGYVTLNVGLTVGWLMLLYRRRDPAFHRLRRALVLATLGAQPIFFVFPCDPPRSLDHMVDTVSDVLDLDSGLVVRLYNPIAAFPSIHLAFAVVTAAGLRERARSRLVRRAARAYPPTVFATVVATGNHYVLDGIAGSALAAVALRLSRALDG
jgi:PAP2 superfamily protein